MRKAWQEQLNNMKQAHTEFKEDIENLIFRREQQIQEMKDGKFIEFIEFRGTRHNQ